MIKVKTKVSGCFRTKDGADDFLKIMSYVGTEKNRDLIHMKQLKMQLQVTQDSFLIRGSE